MVKRSYQEELARLAKRAETSGKGMEAASETLHQHERTILALRAENDQEILAERTKMDKLKMQHVDDIRRRENQLAAERTEVSLSKQKLDEALRQKDKEMEDLRQELDSQRPHNLLAAKEREIENLNLHHQREIEKLQWSLQQQLQHKPNANRWFANKGTAAVQGHPSSSSYSHPAEASPSDLPMPTDVTSLTKELLSLRKQAAKWEDVMEAWTETYEAKMKKLQAEMDKRDDGVDNQFAIIDGHRRRLESENERYRCRLVRLMEETKTQAADLAHLRALKPENDRFREEHPVLTAQNQELLQTKEHLEAENTKLRKERNIWITQMDQVRRDWQAVSVEAEKLRIDQQRYSQDWERLKEDRNNNAIERKKSTKEKKTLLSENRKLRRLLKRGGRDMEDANEDGLAASDHEVSDSASDESANYMTNHDGESCLLILYSNQFYLYRFSRLEQWWHPSSTLSAA